MGDGILIAGVVVLVFALGTASMAWHFSRSRRMVDRWAEENGFRLIDREYRWFFRGPFWWRTSDKMAVYHVTVEDSSGRVRRAFIRCGGWLLGLLSDRVDVEWEE